MLKKLSMVIAGSILLALGVGEAVKAQTANFTTSVFASGLDNPRRLNFRPDGTLYVVEAGIGGDEIENVVVPEVGIILDGGQTGALTRIQNGVQERIITGLPSYAFEDGSGAFGTHDVEFDEQGNIYLITGGGTNQNFRDNVLGGFSTNLGRLLKFGPNGEGPGESIFDFSLYESLNNPNQGDTISNPFDFSIQQDGSIVTVDTGANDVLRLSNDRTSVQALTVFRDRTVGGIEIEPVPSSLATGPDGAYYIGELTGNPYPEGEARIYRLEEIGGEPTVFADGFTQIIDLTFDQNGNLYVLEYAKGDLSQIAPDGTLTTIADQLIFPTSMALGPDGAIYVTNKGSLPVGQGEILRLEPTTAVPEPTSVIGLLAFGAFGTLLRIWRKRHISSCVVDKSVKLTAQ